MQDRVDLDGMEKLGELLENAEWEHRYRYMGHFDGKVVSFLKKNHQDLIAMIAELRGLREAIECACAAMHSPTVWSDPEKYLLIAIPGIRSALITALEESPRDGGQAVESAGNGKQTSPAPGAYRDPDSTAALDATKKRGV